MWGGYSPSIEDVKELGRTIVRGRRRLGMSQTALGDRVGRTHGTISNLERGLTDTPPVELLTAIALELGDNPADYIRMAGRVVLTAADLMPAARDLPVGLLDAIEERMRRAFREELQAALAELRRPQQ